jgi:DNA-binding NtrC family response regulator
LSPAPRVIDSITRLGVFPIGVPPLRERKEDVPLIAWAFVERRRRDLGRRIEEIPRKVMDALVAYDWPGNVRELENVLERCAWRINGPGGAHAPSPGAWRGRGYRPPSTGTRRSSRLSLNAISR